ncbi:MAG TPA: hypothetical protein DEP24_13270 [Mycobacterium sp.]|nr:hypothetical protein [Mycobacterium sp.]
MPMVAEVVPAASDCPAGAVPAVTPAAVAATVTAAWIVICAPSASVAVRCSTTVWPFTKPETVVAPGAVPAVATVAVVEAPAESETMPAVP